MWHLNEAKNTAAIGWGIRSFTTRARDRGTYLTRAQRRLKKQENLSRLLKAKQE